MGIKILTTSFFVKLVSCSIVRNRTKITPKIELRFPNAVNSMEKNKVNSEEIPKSCFNSVTIYIEKFISDPKILEKYLDLCLNYQNFNAIRQVFSLILDNFSDVNFYHKNYCVLLKFLSTKCLSGVDKILNRFCMQIVRILIRLIEFEKFPSGFAIASFEQTKTEKITAAEQNIKGDVVNLIFANFLLPEGF